MEQTHTGFKIQSQEDHKSKPEFFSSGIIRAMKWWERLQKQMDELGWNKAKLSEVSDVNYDSINKYLRGETENPRGNVMEKLASAIGKSVVWLREGVDLDATSTVTPSSVREVPILVAGVVEAGTFREVDQFDQSERVYLNLPPDRKFPTARQLAFEVAGDSMNALRPRPIFPGDRAVGVAFEDIAHNFVLRDGLVVVVERTREDGTYREWSIKQVEIYHDRTEFHPRSNNSRHKPIIVNRDLFADNGDKVEIIALIRRIVNDLD